MPRTYAPELKAQVIAEWKSGDAEAAIAKRHKMPRTTLRQWTLGLTRQVAVANKQDEWDDLGWELLRESTKFLIAVLKHGQDVTWLKGQSADDLAILFGVTFDKSARLYGAAADQRSHHDGGGTAVIPIGPGEDS